MLNLLALRQPRALTSAIVPRWISFCRKMNNADVSPRHLSYDLLKDITNDFSDEFKLGSGAYGKVYKGVHKDGKMIAVKMLYDMPGLDDQQFKMEFNNLTNLRHPNIVRFIGYCHETRPEYVQHNGGLVVADRIHRALCFQYMCNGSLQENIYDEYNGHDWQARYGIIKGICNGLKYLHEELEPPMYHLDLKPANVLLDENMIPRIADFGLSRLFRQEQTQITKSCIGTRGYTPPEYIDMGVVSIKFDIFSLGVIIIKIMTGPKGYFRIAEMSSQEFIDHVHAKWRNRLQETSMYPLESYSKQVRRCIEIGVSCVEADRRKRPSIGDIINQLKETDFSGLLDVHPLQLCFPFEPNELISCPLRLTNNTDYNVSFRCVPKNPQSSFMKLSRLRGILLPRSTCTYLVMMEKQQQPPANMGTLDVILQSRSVSDDMKERALSDSFFMQEKYHFGGKVHEATLTAVCDPASQTIDSELIQPRIKVISCNDGLADILAIDVHPTEPWILTGHYCGSVCMWDYQTRASLMVWKITDGKYERMIASTKFIAQKGWFVSGDTHGYIHVHVCLEKDEVKKFKAHAFCVLSLAVHPSQPFVLSSSNDSLIKLWDWESDWACIHTFKAHSDTVNHVMFNPQDDNTFASVSRDSTIKIWSTFYPNPIITLESGSDGQTCVGYFSTGCDQQYIITGTSRGTAHIWDLQTNTCIRQIHGLQEMYRGCSVGVVDCLLDRPTLITVSHDHAISLRNSSTYRHESTVHFKLGRVYGFVYIKSIRSLAIAFPRAVAIMEIN